MSGVHLQEELLQSTASVVVQTRYGQIKTRRAANGAAVFLEVPYAYPPGRFEDPKALLPQYRYEDKEYVYESSYCAQPNNDGQTAGIAREDVLGLGKPMENPLFVNIVVPPQGTLVSRYPVKVYIHGGFLQFGSPHGLSGQAQYVAAERSEVWVNIGYRLSAFGFLACDEPKVDGNFGFKDQWLALLWIRDNIEAFGGEPSDIQVIGLSAGAHSVHQLLHHISHLPNGEQSPFQSAMLQSNAMLTNPKTPVELRTQFRALCRALGLDPDAPDVLQTLRDPAKVPASAITHVIETDAVGVENGTYRGCLDGTWLPVSPPPMTWQRSGGLARGLRNKGVRSIVVGDLTEEWYLYAIAHPLGSVLDIPRNMQRYYPADVVARLIPLYRTLGEDASEDEVKRLFGDMTGDGQVHFPVRLLTRDLMAANFPVVRYEIRWTPEQVRPLGYVTHATDRPIWALRLPALDTAQVDVARTWLDAVAAEVKLVETQGNTHGLQEVLTLKEDRSIGWKVDERWNGLMRLREALPSEDGELP